MKEIISVFFIAHMLMSAHCFSAQKQNMKIGEYSEENGDWILSEFPLFDPSLGTLQSVRVYAQDMVFAHKVILDSDTDAALTGSFYKTGYWIRFPYPVNYSNVIYSRIDSISFGPDDEGSGSRNGGDDEFREILNTRVEFDETYDEQEDLLKFITSSRIGSYEILVSSVLGVIYNSDVIEDYSEPSQRSGSLWVEYEYAPYHEQSSVIRDDLFWGDTYSETTDFIPIELVGLNDYEMVLSVDGSSSVENREVTIQAIRDLKSWDDLLRFTLEPEEHLIRMLPSYYRLYEKNFFRAFESTSSTPTVRPRS
ncbi:MAG: hypothetical protein ACSHYA_13765 [Opitutaceae bacterium]